MKDNIHELAGDRTLHVNPNWEARKGVQHTKKDFCSCGHLEKMHKPDCMYCNCMRFKK